MGLFKTRPNRKVGFKIAWGHYRVGDVIEPAGTLRSFLIDNGYAVAVPPETEIGPGRFAPAPGAGASARRRRRALNRQMAAE